MRREDIHEIVKRLEPADVSKVILVLRAGFGISIDLFYRFESDYVIVRGREAGTNDDGRGFFIPYDEVVYLKIERIIHANELRKMYGDPEISGGVEYADEEDVKTPEPVPASAERTPVPMTPAAIAKQNLLDRLRAARTSVTATRANGK